jgi:hypothetical protein
MPEVQKDPVDVFSGIGFKKIIIKYLIRFPAI